jgi:hypothetical protein
MNDAGIFALGFPGAMAFEKHKLFPKEYWFAHEYCLELHDQLVNIIANGEANGVFNYKFVFTDDTEYQTFTDRQQSLSREAFFDWLADSEFKNVARELTFRQFTAALLSDFLQFILSALQNSAKGRLSVTYSLLRKPFKDNLLLLEWLLADTQELLDLFLKSEISELSIERITPEKKLSIIKRAISSTEVADWIEAEFLYDLRYNKSSSFSFESMWNRSGHIITTVPTYSTENRNLNFIFSDSQAKSGQWEYLYSSLPILLLHTCQVVDALVVKICSLNQTDRSLASLKRHVGLYLVSQEIPGPSEASFSEATLVVCPKCQSFITLAEKELRSFYSSNKLRCDKCGSKIQIVPYSTIKSMN